MPASCDWLDAEPRAAPNESPRGDTSSGLNTVNVDRPREWIATEPALVTVREATSPITSSSSLISVGCGVKRIAVDCSTVFVPRTFLPST